VLFLFKEGIIWDNMFNQVTFLKCTCAWYLYMCVLSQTSQASTWYIYIYTHMYMDSVAYVNQLYLNNIGKYVSLSYMTVPYLVSTYIYIHCIIYLIRPCIHILIYTCIYIYICVCVRANVHGI
jgi:hypothetical protein